MDIRLDLPTPWDLLVLCYLHWSGKIPEGSVELVTFHLHALEKKMATHSSILA